MEVGKKIRKFRTKELKETQDTAVTMKFNGKTYDEFKLIMKEQGLRPSAVLNTFMKLSNDLLKKEDGGEVAFIFEPVKDGGSSRG